MFERELELFAAEKLARLAHKDQTDKQGKPYIEHVERVVARLDDPEAKVVAWLHDVVEDTPVTLEQLSVLFRPEIVAAVAAITHPKSEPHTEYIQRVKANPLARQVKIADSLDNSDPERIAQLSPDVAERLSKKYRKFLEILRED